MSQEPTQIRLYGLVGDSIVDGPGFRVTVFTQGCPHNCPGCHNPESHDPAGGKVWALDDVEAKFTGNPLLDGITLSGGEPFAQPGPCAALARRAHGKGLNVWAFTGYLYEDLVKRAEEDPDVGALLDETDVLVDGPFMLEQRSLDLLYKGSRNQRLIDMTETRRTGRVTLWAPPEW